MKGHFNIYLDLRRCFFRYIYVRGKNERLRNCFANDQVLIIHTIPEKFINRTKHKNCVKKQYTPGYKWGHCQKHLDANIDGCLVSANA